MNVLDIRAELSIKSLEFERAMDLGMPVATLITLYKELKILQYQLTLAELEEKESQPQLPEDSQIIVIQ